MLGKGADVDAPQFEPGPIRSTSLSDVDVSETSSEDDTPAKERVPATRPAPTMSAAPRDSASWMEVDPSIALALAVPLGSWLTGGDHLKNLFLALLLVVYLHQLISGMWTSHTTRHDRLYLERPLITPCSSLGIIPLLAHAPPTHSLPILTRR